MSVGDGAWVSKRQIGLAHGHGWPRANQWSDSNAMSRWILYMPSALNVKVGLHLEWHACMLFFFSTSKKTHSCAMQGKSCAQLLPVRALGLTWWFCFSRGKLWCLGTRSFLCNFHCSLWGLCLWIKSLNAGIDKVQQLLPLCQSVIELFKFEDLLSRCLAWQAIWLI